MRSKKPLEKKEVSFDNIVQSKNGACYTIHTSPEHFDAWCRIFKLRYRSILDRTMNLTLLGLVMNLKKLLKLLKLRKMMTWRMILSGTLKM